MVDPEGLRLWAVAVVFVVTQFFTLTLPLITFLFRAKFTLESHARRIDAHSGRLDQHDQKLAVHDAALFGGGFRGRGAVVDPQACEP